MNRKRIVFLSSILFIVLVVINYGPMLYRQFTGNGGTWVEYYKYNTTSDKLLADILAFKQKHKQLWPPNDTNLCVDNVGGVYIKFYDEGNYYHVWVQNTTLIFGGISTTPKYEDAKLINRDLDFITRQKTINRLEKIILDNMTLKPTATQ
jgi:hypothetical protein